MALLTFIQFTHKHVAQKYLVGAREKINSQSKDKLKYKFLFNGIYFDQNLYHTQYTKTRGL